MSPQFVYQPRYRGIDRCTQKHNLYRVRPGNIAAKPHGNGVWTDVVGVRF